MPAYPLLGAYGCSNVELLLQQGVKLSLGALYLVIVLDWAAGRSCSIIPSSAWL